MGGIFYEGWMLSRDVRFDFSRSEIKAADKERKELNAGLAKANKEIDSLKSTVSGLEISLSSSKELASATHKSFEVRTRAIGQSARTPTISP
jgi:predicted  nucleic acid-binding Zn-ribbon protein